MSKRTTPIDVNRVLQSHRMFWNNKPGLVLRRRDDYSRDPLRIRIYNENISGEFTPEMIESERLVDETLRVQKKRSLLNGDVFEYARFAPAIPWLEAIAGCRLYALGKGASIIANPSGIEPRALPSHLQYVLSNSEENAWFRELAQSYRALAEGVGGQIPLSQSAMRGPGDMVGALLGHENFVERMLKPADNVEYLKELLDLSTKLFIKTVKMQLELSKTFEGGYCDRFGLWAPGFIATIQEDEASLVSPQLYNDYLLPYHVLEANAFDYSVFHMHSSFVTSVYNWKDFCQMSNIKALEIALDPRGPMINDLMGTLLEMNCTRPLIISSINNEQAQSIERYISQFPGSVLHSMVDVNTLSFAS